MNEQSTWFDVHHSIVRPYGMAFMSYEYESYYLRCVIANATTSNRE
jgi:hypothetical protein